MSYPGNWPDMGRSARTAHRPPKHPTRRSRRPLIIIAVVLFIAFASRTGVSYYVDALWFASVGYAQVFWKTLGIQSAVFLAFAAATLLILYGSFVALKKAHFSNFPDSHTIYLGGQPVKLPVEPVLRFIAIAGS
ncbi:MAG TPA: UPF0182 family protein, partial [Candidatus Angelobacter sp.]|nr:UPF0182 family protein [Candidatus Angelobacter sp.]